MVEAVKAKAGSQQGGGRKWLGRIGRFLMYGGWLLLAVVGVGIAIAISMIGK